MAIITDPQFRGMFQSSFNGEKWQQILINIFAAKDLRQVPQILETSTGNETGYFLGEIDKTADYRIGFFRYDIHSGSVAHKKVGLRNLVKSFTNPKWGIFDAVVAVFDDNKNWRVSFISDIKGEATNSKRFTFVFGERNEQYNTAVSRFQYLQNNGISFETLKEAFSVEALTKEFYNELFNWYQWALSDEVGITFPNDINISDDDRNIEEHLIRLITRLMFVWFIKEKSLVPEKLFEEHYLRTILKNFIPQSAESGNYYNAILQNLFFATLNKEIDKRAFASDDPIFVKRIEHYGIKTLYRYSNLFTISEKEIIKLFASIPFLNGGLFECFDKSNDNGKVIYYDGFSRNKKKIAFIPNMVFFDEGKGIIPLLKKYNFTIEENSPNDTQVALDPELLGKVFENLLGAYNPETKETARNQSGSFYTPREVVNYMVDESLINYILNKVRGISEDEVRELFRNNEMPESIKSNQTLVKSISSCLQSVRILDPACGSGAFPMGALNRIVELLKILYEFKGTNTCSLKLHLIENCIYGSDIQTIAVQISKLRFFISLICEQNKEEEKDNFGIIPMPNLETKFVTANTLIGLKTSEPNLFDTEIRETKQKLLDVRHEHFSAKNSKEKTECRKKDKELRDRLTALLESNNYCSHEDAEQLAAWNPYDQNQSSSFFDIEWMFGFNDGFDIVLGNPPYIQLQNNGGQLGELYSNCGYQTFARTGDIYCLFYERGCQLLRPGGHLCFITSNKWMRAGYGEKTREFFAKKTNPKLLIDFGGVKIFESATVDTNILLFAKEASAHKVICAVTKKEDKNRIKELSDFVRQNNSVCSFDSSDSWVILSPIEQSIKRKIEAIGTPLKDWDIQINYGIKTGYNEAFIIGTEKRNEILANCSTPEERARTEELIRPILRGRDIKRYSYEWANLYLIATFPSRHYDIEQYPAVKNYLLSFGMERLEQTGETHIVNGEIIKARKLTNNKWFETQDSISYLEDFSKPKVMYPNMTKYLPFYYDIKGFYQNDKSFMITGKHI
ncbi:MAG: Eco57I restriction-modification methylase domain-containing protein, partial [Bacteroidales bacterium]|nr:Eco57I restriction-modification methylase domain-containing protein [Bacteroidales bacterium]